MSLGLGEEIGLEVHDDNDQFLRIESGKALIKMGKAKDELSFEMEAEEDFAIIIPAGMWHNIINIGKEKLKLYSIYAPPEHPHGTIHITKQDAREHHTR